MAKVKVNGSLKSDYIVISIKTDEDIRPCVAEISKIDDQWYFNRLNVPDKIRRNGYGTCLMEELVNILDNNEIDLICDLNPSGEMNMAQLTSFYKKFGFIYTNASGRPIRKHKRR